jgi:hypothetical protein
VFDLYHARACGADGNYIDFISLELMGDGESQICE